MRHRTRPLVARRDARIVVAILIVALGVRLLVVALTWDYRPATDDADYQRHGESIAAGHGYPPALVAFAGPGGGPSAFRPPAYPYLLGGLYAITGPRWNAARLVQAFVGTITVALIGLVGFQLFGRATGLISMAVAAIAPPLVLIGATLMSETLFLPLELGAIAATLQHRRSRDGYRWIVLAGALAGLATLTRTHGAVLVLALAVGAWILKPRLSGRALAQPAALVAAAAIVVLPWTIRNAVVMDDFIPVTTQDGYSLAGIYNRFSASDERYPASWHRPERLREFADIYEPQSGYAGEPETSAEMRRRALDYLRDHPLYVAEVVFWNTVRMFELTGLDWGERVAREMGIDRGLADVGIAGFWILGILAIGGAFTAGARRVPAFIWLAAALFVASIVVLSGTTRYRMPVEPFVILLAALALDAGWRRFRTLDRGAMTG